MGGFSEDIVLVCDNVDGLSRRLHYINKTQELLSTPRARQILQVADEPASLHDEYENAATAMKTQLQENGNDVAGYILGNILRCIQKDAATILAGRQTDQSPSTTPVATKRPTTQ